MQAWQFTAPGDPLTRADIAQPEPAPGEVIIDIKASGLCHTMVGILDGGLSFLVPSPPQTLGDELAGVISAVGSGVTGLAVGDRVAHAAIGAETAGVGRDGGFAEYVAVPADRVIPIPERVGFMAAAVATDAGATSYTAVHQDGQVQPGEKVAIVGFGGLGSIAAQIAHAAGAEVHVAEVHEQARALAEATGRYRVVSRVLDLPANELDVIMDFAGMSATTAGAIEVIAPYGRIIQVGTGETTATVPLPALIAKHVRIIGSTSDSPDALRAVLDLLDREALSFNLTEIAFDEIGAGIQRLQRGEVRGRLVATQP